LNLDASKNRHLNAALAAGVKSGFFVKNKGKYKLGAAAKAKPKKAKKKGPSKKAKRAAAAKKYVFVMSTRPKFLNFADTPNGVRRHVLPLTTPPLCSTPTQEARRRQEEEGRRRQEEGRRQEEEVRILTARSPRHRHGIDGTQNFLAPFFFCSTI